MATEFSKFMTRTVAIRIKNKTKSMNTVKVNYKWVMISDSHHVVNNVQNIE